MGSNPFGVAVNIALNKIYVANSADASVSVIDGNTDTIIKTIGGSDIKSPLGIVANPVTNMVYMTNFQYGDGFITIINGTDDTTEGKIQTDIDSQPYYVALDAGKELLYVTHQVGGMLTVIDLATNNITQTIPTPASPVGVDVIPSLSRVYVAETGASIVTVGESIIISPSLDDKEEKEVSKSPPVDDKDKQKVKDDFIEKVNKIID